MSLKNLIKNNDIIGLNNYQATDIEMNSKDDFGYSLLHITIADKKNQLAKYLIDKGIDVNIQDKNGKTALHYVAEYNQIELAEHIIKKGGDLSISDEYGNQPLWTAIFNDFGRNERIKIIELFINHGANINHKNKVDKSPKDIIIIREYDNLKSLL